ncbi:DNA topology modulation protein FlaR [Staphylococcus delphini]|uniref:DNA topology modulation protein FlaR n=1 Tax=Staphylococcus delphini TaxID=53344 RepID=A0AAQ0D7E2_9STAP|nr:DNA topology modulation protein FlaR [Staphylococcus delphini]PCF85259.1 DNA topology modulation protein FlaR [Staphylococcus delphini]QUM67173.1 DNA topology modulation protein FlaR [Staphylococcus delphini]QUM69618.1 DNA topology modulation protein FlaR [Staphylococcus delphini]
MYRRIVILGMPGSGKSTLCVKIGRALNIPTYHLDRYAWEGDALVPAEVLQQQVTEIVKADAWVMDGTYEATLDDRLARADLLIWLTDARWRCILRVIRRYVMRKIHPQTGDNPDIISWEFIRYIWQYERQKTERILCIYRRHADHCELWRR